MTNQEQYELICEKAKKYDDRFADVFDKISAEIEQEYNRLRATRTDEILELGECLGLKLSLKIIDKYRADIGGK